MQFKALITLFLVSVAASSIGDKDDKFMEAFVKRAQDKAQENLVETLDKISKLTKEREEAIAILNQKIANNSVESELSLLQVEKNSFMRLEDSYTKNLATLWEQKKNHEESVKYWQRQLQNPSS